MTVPRRAVLAALAALPVATLLPAVTTAQEIKVRGQTIRLSSRDKKWIKKRCEQLGHTEGTPAYQECYDGWVKDILEQRARDAVYRADGP
jgi:hypothetical protein